ncbi:MAG: T9SS type A sorting domain-containing protein, partial [Bacteroidales bacterium]
NFSKGAILDSKGNIYIAGSFRNKLRQDGKEVESLGDEDIFVAKFYNCPENYCEIENTDPICPGETRELLVRSGHKDIVWNDTIPGTNKLLINKPGKYWVSMIDERGCYVTDTADIQQHPHLKFSLGSDTILLISDSLILNAPKGFKEYVWHDYSFNKSYLAKAPDRQPGNYYYWLCATDSMGCQASDTISIEYIENFKWIDLSGDATIITYPNPAHDWLYWYINTENFGKLILELTDENGRIVHNEKIDNYLPGEIKQLKMHDFPSGAYYLSITSKKNKRTLKILHDQKK